MPDAGERARLLQIALNEAAFRRVNEDIYGPGKTAADLPSHRIVCECGAESCEITLTIDATLYRAVRADPHRFLVKVGHEIPEAETVVEQHGEIGVVEKLPGEARQVAEDTNPRSSALS
jgi:hypothetical protein